MAFFFGDGFDCYATLTDCGTYWDASFGAGVTLNLSATGRFAGSRGVGAQAAGLIPYITKTSGVNDAIHHLVIAFDQPGALSGTTAGMFVTLFDGATAQCSVVFRSDGAILLTSGGATGTTLATYTGAVTAINTWYAFEIEVVVSNTVGGMRVRKNGNISNDYDSFISVGNLDTSQTANNYANKIGVGCNWGVFLGQIIDDFLWRSDASSVTWAGDVRCYTRMPAADSSVAWTRNAATVPRTPNSGSSGSNATSNQARYTPFTPDFNGNISSVILQLTVTSTANFKCAIYASNGAGSTPGTSLGSATPISAPTVGANTFTFGTPVAVTAGTLYYVAFNCDATSGQYTCTSGAFSNSYTTSSTVYASWPANNPTSLSQPSLYVIFTVNMATTANAQHVLEAQQDGAASYVYSSTVSQSDLYTIAAIGSTPAGVLAVTTRGYMQKSDAGTRLAAVQIQSGAANVQATPLALPAGSWAWNWRTDLTDPNIAGALPTSWSPTDKTGNMTLSGSNLVITSTSATSGGARTQAGSASGKYYWEVTFNTIVDVFGSFAGVTIGANSLSSIASTSLGAGGASAAGSVYANGSNVAGGTGITAGGIMCFALDAAAGTMWVRLGAAAQWNFSGTANPATGVGGFSIGAGGAAIYPFQRFDATGEQVTANFGATAFVGVVPSGFSAGFLAFAPWTATAVNNATIGVIVTT